MAALVRTGRQRALLAADPVASADTLADPAAVTALLGDLLDQPRSSGGPPARWVVRGVRVAGRTLHTTLVPHVTRVDRRVVIDAPTSPDSDANARITLDMEVRDGPGGAGTELLTDWRLELSVPIPRAALLLAAPALDRTIESTVRRILDRTVAAIDGA